MRLSHCRWHTILLVCWIKGSMWGSVHGWPRSFKGIQLREALFSGKVLIVSRTRSGMFHGGVFDRHRKKKKEERADQQSPSNIGKSPGKSGKSRKGTKRRQIGTDESKSGRERPPFQPPPGLPALDRGWVRLLIGILRKWVAEFLNMLGGS